MAARSRDGSADPRWKRGAEVGAGSRDGSDKIGVGEHENYKKFGQGGQRLDTGYRGNPKPARRHKNGLLSPTRPARHETRSGTGYRGNPKPARKHKNGLLSLTRPCSPDSVINHEWHAQGHEEATRDAQSLTLDVAMRPSGSVLTRRRVGGDTRLGAWEFRYRGIR